MSEQIVLAVAGLSKSYGSLKAVQELSFSVASGEIFGVLGPNGSGKTTTIECILGTRTKDSGQISVLGLHPKEQRRELFSQVGVQFQDSAFQPGIRVGEICEFTSALYDSRPDWRGPARRFDLEKRINTSVESLSGGERQKLSILLACLHEPKLVFLDELTTGLDSLARRATWAMIKAMQQEGVTVVLTSHFMDEVERLCSRCLVLKEGRKVAEGSIDEIRVQGGGDSFEESYITIVGGAA